MGEVWKWGGDVDAQSWRTSGDLGFELDRIFDVALRNSGYRQYSKPGEWNDPDYIQIGWIGSARGMGIRSLQQCQPICNMPTCLYGALWLRL